MSKPGGGNLIEPGVEPASSGCLTGDCTTHLKRSAVMSGTGIHRLIYRDICVAATAHNTTEGVQRFEMMRHFCAGGISDLGSGLGLLRVQSLPEVTPKPPLGLFWIERPAPSL